MDAVEEGVDKLFCQSGVVGSVAFRIADVEGQSGGVEHTSAYHDIFYVMETVENPREIDVSLSIRRNDQILGMVRKYRLYCFIKQDLQTFSDVVSSFYIVWFPDKIERDLQHSAVIVFSIWRAVVVAVETFFT